MGLFLFTLHWEAKLWAQTEVLELIEVETRDVLDTGMVYNMGQMEMGTGAHKTVKVTHCSH